MIRRFVLFLFLTAWLAACGQGEGMVEPTAAVVTETAAVVVPATETSAPAATDTAVAAVEATAPTAAAATSTTAAPTSAPAPATAAPTATATAQSGIPSGRTDAGIFYLGQPDAPVTVRDYSDFL